MQELIDELKARDTLIDALKAVDTDPEVINLCKNGRIWVTDTDVFMTLGEATQAKVNKVLELADNLLVKENGRSNWKGCINTVRLGQSQGYSFDIRSGKEDMAGIYTPVCNIAFDCY